jgi:hypothetical protein
MYESLNKYQENSLSNTVNSTHTLAAHRLANTPLIQRREKERAGLFSPVQCQAEGIHQYTHAMVEEVSHLTGKSIQPKIQLNSARPAEYGAHAIRQDNRVDIAPGRLRDLGHELTHVTQGTVQATGSVNGAAINDDHQLENHADHIGHMAHSKVVGQLGFDPT